MVCQGCGATYDSSFNFCPYCGRAKLERSGKEVRVDEGRWEVCEIEFEHIRDGGFFTKPQWKLVAYAIGPKGEYIAAETPVYTDYSDYKPGKPKYEGLRLLIQKLCDDGWEYVEHPAGKGDLGQRFRRRIK